MSIHVGVIGIGMMGRTHLGVYAALQDPDVRVTAISDLIPQRMESRSGVAGNIEGQTRGELDLAHVKRYDEGRKLIADPDIDVVDICLPTPLHLDFARAALQAGKHVLVEKPLARTADDARELVRAAQQARTLAMPAMCMRFWPGWDWLRQAIERRTYGKVLAAHFRRVSSHPGGPFYSDGRQAGGAVLDLHIHDTDFVHWCFGVPASVYSRGYSTLTGQPDHVMTHYLYDGPDDPKMVTAEGGWVYDAGFGFHMQYTVKFERATASFDLAREQPLKLIQTGGKPEPVALSGKQGYAGEIRYFLDCVRNNRPPSVVTLADAALSVAIVEAEVRSIASGAPEPVRP